MLSITEGALRVFGSAAALGLLVACGSSADGTVAGDLGRGRFKYLCVSDQGDDAACKSGTKETYDFPSFIAVGSTFKLSYEPNGDIQTKVGNAVIKPASNEIVSDDAIGLFTAKQAGRIAMVARSSSNGKVADFTYLQVAKAQTLKIRVPGEVNQPVDITVPKGDTKIIRAEAYGTSDVLAGTLKLDWKSSDTTKVSIKTQTPSARIEISGDAEGESIIEASLPEDPTLKPVSLKVKVTP